MKKLKFLPILLLLFACDRSGETTLEVEKVPVTFKVSALKVNVSYMTKTVSTRASTDSTVLGNVINSLSYYIFDSNMKYVQHGTTSFTPGVDPIPESFGKIQLNLPAGTYKVIFVGRGDGSGSLLFDGYNPALTYESRFLCDDRESFYYTSDIVVSTTSANFPINLTRTSGLVGINISDNIPADVSKVTVTLGYYYHWYVYQSETYTLQNYVSRTYDMASTSGKLDPFTYNIVKPQSIKVTFKIYDVNNSVLDEQSVTVPVYENRKTMISGNLFEAIGKRNFSITISDAWGEDYNVIL